MPFCPAQYHYYCFSGICLFEQMNDDDDHDDDDSFNVFHEEQLTVETYAG